MERQPQKGIDVDIIQPQELFSGRNYLTLRQQAMWFISCLYKITEQMSWDLKAKCKQFPGLEEIKHFGNLMAYGRTWNSCYDFAVELLEVLEEVEESRDKELEDIARNFLIEFGWTNTAHLIKSMKFAVEELPEPTELDAQKYKSFLLQKGYIKRNWKQ